MLTRSNVQNSDKPIENTFLGFPGLVHLVSFVYRIGERKSLNTAQTVHRGIALLKITLFEMFLHTWVEASSLAKSNDPLLIKYYVDF